MDVSIILRSACLVQELYKVDASFRDKMNDFRHDVKCGGLHRRPLYNRFDKGYLCNSYLREERMCSGMNMNC